jgi:hypothetical protein
VYWRPRYLGLWSLLCSPLRTLYQRSPLIRGLDKLPLYYNPPVDQLFPPALVTGLRVIWRDLSNVIYPVAFRRQWFQIGPVSRGKDLDRRFEDRWREVVKVARSPEMKNGRATAPPSTVWNRIWTYDSHLVGLAIRLQPCVGVHKRMPRKVWRPQPLWWVADCTNLWRISKSWKIL